MIPEVQLESTTLSNPLQPYTHHLARPVGKLSQEVEYVKDETRGTLNGFSANARPCLSPFSVPRRVIAK